MKDTALFLAELTSALKYEDLTPADRAKTIMLIKDFYAAAIAGKRVNGCFNDAITEFVLGMGGTEESTVLFSQRKLPAANAALLNASYEHGADMDDGTKAGMGHVAAPVMPGVFAIAEREHKTGREIMTAVVAGYEVFIRLAAACQPGIIFRGFHSTGTVGSIAAAAACSKLLGLSTGQIAEAIAIATLQASGLFSISESGQAMKPINPGRAAYTGVLSAHLASRGVKGPAEAFEMRAKGYFHAMTNGVNEEILFAPMGENHLICGCYQKPYPSCRHTHGGIDAALVLREKFNSIDELADIKLYTYQTAIHTAGQIAVPANTDDAKFSIQYSVANTLIKGHYGLEDLDVESADPAIAKLAARVELIADPSLENIPDGIRGARLELTMKDGSKHIKEVALPKGDDITPFDDDDIRRKLAQCAGSTLCAKAQQELLERIDAIDTGEGYVIPNVFPVTV